MFCAFSGHTFKARPQERVKVILRSGWSAENEDRPPAWHGTPMKVLHECGPWNGILCRSLRGQCLSEPAGERLHEDAVSPPKRGMIGRLF